MSGDLTAHIETKVSVTIDVDVAAKWFANVNDEVQAQFFKAVAREAESFPVHQREQWWLVGAHVAECECSSDGARELLQALYDGMHDRQQRLLTCPRC